MLDLRLFHINLHSAQRVYQLDQAVEIDADILRDVQIQVRIQHENGLLRAAGRIGRVALVIGIVAQVEIGITINADQLHLVRILIDGSDHDGIGTVTLLQIVVSGVYTEKRDIAVTLHGFIFFHAIIHVFNDLTLIDGDMLNGILLSHRPEN